MRCIFIKEKTSLASSTQKEALTLENFVNFFVCLLAFGCPLFITKGFSNISTSKNEYYYFVAIAMCVVTVMWLLIEAFIKRKSKQKTEKTISLGLSPLDICVLAFGFFVVISAFLSEYQEDVWTGGNSRHQGVTKILLYIAVYFVVSRFYKGSQTVLLFSVLAFVIVCSIGVSNCFGLDPLNIHYKISEESKKIFISSIGNINFYSSYVCLLFPLVLCGFCCTKEKTSKVIYTIALVVASLGMMVTSSESFVFGFVGSLLVFPLFLLNDVEKLKKFLIGVIVIILTAQIYKFIYGKVDMHYYAISLLLSMLLKTYISVPIIAICGILFIWLYVSPERIKTVKYIYIAAFTLAMIGVVALFVIANTVGFTSLGFADFDKFFRINDTWGTNRGEIWRKSIEHFKEFSLKEKLFGVGPEAFFNVLTEGLSSEPGKRLDQAHNEYLQHLITIGICGVLSYISIIVTIAIVMFRKLKNNIFAVGLFSGLVAYWIQAVVNIAQVFSTPVMYLFIALLGAIYYMERSNSKKGNYALDEQC